MNFHALTHNDVPEVLGLLWNKVEQIQQTLFKMSENPNNDTMTVSEVAEMLRKSKATIYAWTSNNKIPFEKAGNTLLFSRKKITEWLKENSKDETEEIEKMFEELNKLNT